MTWLLVSTRPSLLMTIPVPAPASLSYCSELLMRTTPGLTLLMIALSALLVLPPLAGGPDDELPGVGTDPAPGNAGVPLAEVVVPGWSSASVAPTPTATASTATARWLSTRPPRRFGGGGGGKPP